MHVQSYGFGDIKPCYSLADHFFCFKLHLFGNCQSSHILCISVV